MQLFVTFFYNRGIQKVLLWIHNRYSPATLHGKPLGANPELPIIITENGVDVPGESSMSLKEGLTIILDIVLKYTLDVFILQFVS